MSPNPLDELKSLERRSEPAWLWDLGRTRIVWANRAGLAFWGETSILDLLERQIDAADAGARRVGEIATAPVPGGDRDPDAGNEIVETFVFRTAGGAAAIEMSCRQVLLDDGRDGLLMVRRSAPDAASENGNVRASLLQTVIAELPVPVLVFDRHGSLVYDNQAARQLLSSEGEGEASPLATWLGDADAADALIAQTLDDGSVSEAMNFATRHGLRAQRVNTRRIAAPLVGRMAVLMTVEDIEDRRRLERLRAATADAAETIVATADAIFRLDSDGRLVEFEASGGAFGDGTGVLIGSLWDDALAALEIEPGQPIAARLAAGEPWREVLTSTPNAAESPGKSFLVAALPDADVTANRADAAPGARGLIVTIDAAANTLASVLVEIERMSDAAPGAGAIEGDAAKHREPEPDLPGENPTEDGGTKPGATATPDESPKDAPDEPDAAPEADRPSGRIGRDDDATFSAIARALGVGRNRTPPPEPATKDAGNTTLRVVGGVDTGRKRSAMVAAPAQATTPQPAPEPDLQPKPDADRDPARLDHGRAGLIHRHFSILDATGPLAFLFGYASREAILEDGNLLNLLPDERARLFSLQSRFDDSDLPESGRIEDVTLRARRRDRSHVELSAAFEEILVDGEPAIRIEFEPATPAAREAAAPEEMVPEETAEDIAAASLQNGMENTAAPAPAPAEVTTARQADTSDSEELDAAAGRERELRAIINTAADGIATIDGDGNVVTLNASAEAIFGLEAVRAVGRKFSDLFAPESTRTIEAYLQSAASSESTRLHREGHEARLRRADGSEAPTFVTIGRMAVDNGSRFCAVIRDISQWKETEEGLRLAKQRAEEDSSKKSDFLARISHELRTPLNAIIGFSEVMSEEKFGPIANDRYKGYLNDIRSSGGHLLSLINDLLDLSKIEAGKLDLNFTSVDVGRVIEQGVSIIQPQAGRARVIVRVSLPEQLPAVVADERSLRQIVLNLLSNAVKFTPPGGQVILSAVVDDQGRLQIRVRDTGVGMTREEIGRAMEPFRQIENAAQPGLTGTGLGLPLTKALTEANRAEFSIESTPSAGTLVHITFPTNRVLDG